MLEFKMVCSPEVLNICEYLFSNCQIFQGCCGDDGSLMETDGSHSGRTLGLTTAELKHLLQNKEETPESLLLDLEKHVMVKEFK